MNAQDADPLMPEPLGDSPPPADGETAAAKPKRKRAPRKPAAAAAPEAGEMAEPPASAVLAETSLEEPNPFLAFPPTAVSVRASKRKTAHAADSAGPANASADTLADAPADAPAEAAGGLTSEGSEREREDLGEGAGEGTNKGAGEGTDKPRTRRSRNRRRGRRGADKHAAGEAPDGLNEDGRAPTDGAAGAELEAGADIQEGGQEGSQMAGQPPLAATPSLPPAEAGEVFAEVLSGLFDIEPDPAAGAPALPPAQTKRVLAAEPDAPKLHKVLAQSGAGSRRDLEQMIADARVTVNGQPAHTGQRISFGDRIAIDGKPVRVRIAPPPPRVLAYHKPSGEVVSHDDPQQRPTVFRRLPRLQQGKWQSVGRLDINTEGLLLFTNSGELANQLMHPRFGVEREYAVRSLGTLSPEAKARLLEGVDIDGQACAFKGIEDGGGEGVNHWYRCVITEGRNREVRKLFEAVGHAVSRLIRIRYGSVVLPRGLKRGVWVDLGENDLRELRRLAGHVPRPERERDSEEGPDGAGRHGRNRRGGRKRRDGSAGSAPGNEVAAERPPRQEGPPRSPRQDRPDRPPRPERPERAPRAERADRAERPPREERAPRGPRPEPGEGGPIPNPLQQTFDKRAIQQERALRRDMPEDGPIPNPLQQTYDKRALIRDRAPQREIPEDGPIPNPLQQTYDKRFASNGGFGGPGGRPDTRSGPGGNRAGAGGGRGKGRPGGGKKGAPGAPREPDPMQTSVGFIGGDAYLRKGGPRGGPRSGGRGPGGGPGKGPGGGQGGGGQGGGQGSGPKGGGGGGGRGGRGR